MRPEGESQPDGVDAGGHLVRVAAFAGFAQLCSHIDIPTLPDSRYSILSTHLNILWNPFILQTKLKT